MEKIVLVFSEKEKELLDQCSTITGLKPTPLLRTLIAQCLNEMLHEMRDTGKVTLETTGRRTAPISYRLPIPVDENIAKRYEEISGYLPIWKAELTSQLVIAKLKKIQDKNQTIGELIT